MARSFIWYGCSFWEMKFRLHFLGAEFEFSSRCYKYVTLAYLFWFSQLLPHWVVLWYLNLFFKPCSFSLSSEGAGLLAAAVGLHLQHQDPHRYLHACCQIFPHLFHLTRSCDIFKTFPTCALPATHCTTRTLSTRASFCWPSTSYSQTLGSLPSEFSLT